MLCGRTIVGSIAFNRTRVLDDETHSPIVLVIVSIVGLGIFFILHMGSQLPSLGRTRQKKDAHSREKLMRARANGKIARLVNILTVDVNADESDRVRILRGE